MIILESFLKQIISANKSVMTKKKNLLKHLIKLANTKLVDTFCKEALFVEC